MLRTLAVATFIAFPLFLEASANEPACEFDKQAMLNLDFDSFDQTFGSGWRLVADNEGCSLTAADLIRDYIELHQPGQKIIVFHEAQMRAKGGQTDRAISLFKKTRYDDGRNLAFGWNEYVDATIAFLKQDRESLFAARESLLSIPKPSSFRAVDRNGDPVEVEWPPNVSIVNSFVACFEQPYAVAYGGCELDEPDEIDKVR